MKMYRKVNVITRIPSLLSCPSGSLEKGRDPLIYLINDLVGLYDFIKHTFI